MDLDERFKAYVSEKVSRLERYGSKVEEAHVIFSKERFSFISEITLSGKRLRLTAIEKNEVLEASFDLCMANIEKQLKKFRGRIKKRRVLRFLDGIKRLSPKRRRSTSSSPSIIRQDPFLAKPMSAEEAAMELDLFKKDFIVFINSAHDKINVIYRLNDGNYGLVDP